MIAGDAAAGGEEVVDIAGDQAAEGNLVGLDAKPPRRSPR